MKSDEVTIVICCAGMGARLGIGTTKSMLDIEGKPLIIRQLEMLKDYDDVRIVVGFQAQKVIDVVTAYRKNIMFVFNHEYKTTGVADSFFKGIKYSRDKVIYMDGDILFNAEDFNTFLKTEESCMCFSTITSNEPLRASVSNGKIEKLCVGDEFCWPGLAKVSIDQLRIHSSHMYSVLSDLLPIKAIHVRSREIDTPDDYERAIVWFRAGCN